MRHARLIGLGVLLAAVLTTFTAHTQPQPWPVRVKLTLIRMLDGPGGVTVAQTIQRITHPTGSDANLQNWDVQPVGDGVQVKLYVTWSGGLGAAHTTAVAWDFNRRHHRSAAVLSDNAPFPVAEKNARQLETYFRDQLYPYLHERMGD